MVISDGGKVEMRHDRYAKRSMMQGVDTSLAAAAKDW